MSQEVLEIVQRMNWKDIETQLALQCAPLITGLKISNLLIISSSNLHRVKQILKDTYISHTVLFVSKEKIILLLYNKRKLEQYLSEKKAKNLLRELGYQEFTLNDVLPAFQLRYQNYMLENTEFPHEMGVLLGYPIGDVKGFIYNEGRNFLYTGYWKVYENVTAAKKLFHKFEIAEETLIQLISNGISMEDILDIYGDDKLQQIAG